MFLKAKTKRINIMKKVEISASIVLYHENLEELSNTIQCFLNVDISKKLYLIDNTNDVRFKGLFTPYINKKLGEVFRPISISPASIVGLSYNYPEDE